MMNYVSPSEVEVDFSFDRLEKTDDGYVIVVDSKERKIPEPYPIRMFLVEDSLFETLKRFDKTTIDSIKRITLP